MMRMRGIRSPLLPQPAPRKTSGEYAQGYRRPFGVFVPPDALAEQLAETAGTVTRADTPFPGTHIYFPTDGKSHPSIFFLHGSDGGASGWPRKELQRRKGRHFFGTRSRPGSLLVDPESLFR